ncbi:hypothetical protein GCM10023238_22690 [Streptomyces heliomycini]
MQNGTDLYALDISGPRHEGVAAAPARRCVTLAEREDAGPLGDRKTAGRAAAAASPTVELTPPVNRPARYGPRADSPSSPRRRRVSSPRPAAGAPRNGSSTCNTTYL